jgi:hypothetical protein
MSETRKTGRFQPGQSGNPGGKPAAAELSALARRYTADWLRGLVEVVRLPAKDHASAVVAAARELREVGYPGLTKGPSEGGASALHLHLLAVTQVKTVEAPAADWIEADPDEAPIQPTLVPRPDGRLPHEAALPLWDAAGEAGEGDDVEAG